MPSGSRSRLLPVKVEIKWSVQPSRAWPQSVAAARSAPQHPVSMPGPRSEQAEARLREVLDKQLFDEMGVEPFTDADGVRSLRRELTSWMVLRAFGEAAELTGFGKRRFWQAA